MDNIHTSMLVTTAKCIKCSLILMHDCFKQRKKKVNGLDSVGFCGTDYFCNA